MLQEFRQSLKLTPNQKRVVRLTISITAQNLQSCAQGFDFIEQLQSQGSPGKIDAKIALQTQGYRGTTHVNAAEAPAMRLTTEWREYPFVDQFDDTFRMNCAGLAEFGQRQFGQFFENYSAQLRQQPGIGRCA
jgi:uncharacterized protein HemY